MRTPPALALADAELRRVTRDRTFLFFLVVLPIMVILLVGLTTASSDSIRLALVPGPATPLATQLVHDIEARPGVKTQRVATRAQGVDALRRGEVEAVVVVPPTLDADLRSGATTQIPLLVSADGFESHPGYGTSRSPVACDYPGTITSAERCERPIPRLGHE